MGEPGIIKKLDETVVNRIAAGEIIQRPANALKELLENSLDANSTSIQIVLKSGGLKLLQIQDNGTGIRTEDLNIVCERFTTSKLRHFEDLGNIGTFGFRGEALASVSHVAHLTITTKTSYQQCAYKASYLDGKLKGPPKACAGNQGTTITVEDLFYNVPTRKNALKNPSEEYAKAAEVVSRYAIHNSKVGFTLKKQGEHVFDVKSSPNSTYIENIRNVYGDAIAKNIIEVESSDETLKFNLHGFVSNVNFSSKKQIFILFINNRLVDSSALKKVLQDVFSTYLPKGAYPFIYLSITLDPKNVDVNVHPTKHEVHFLHEDAIIDKTRQALEEKLLGANESRVFYTQAKLPVSSNETVLKLDCVEKAAPSKMVRTDSTTQKIDRFFNITHSENAELLKEDSKSNRREIKLISVHAMRSEIESSCSAYLRELVTNLTFVGCIDEDKALVQYGTKLYMFNSKKFREELFYQILVCDFGNFGAIKFKNPLSLYEISLIGLEDPASEWKEEDGEKCMLAESITELIFSKREMLMDYFSLEIDEEKQICTIPLLLDDYMPDISRLPHYILRLACDVDWKEEKPCFEGICRETALFYSYMNLFDEESDEQWKWVTEHVVYPAIKKYVFPKKSFADDETVLELADLPNLYKVFERC